MRASQASQANPSQPETDQDVPLDSSSIDAVIRRLRDLKDGPSALQHVVGLGSAAIPSLERLLSGPSESVGQPRSLAADALGLIGGRDATAALLRALDDSIHRPLEPVREHVEYVVTNSIADNLGRLADSSALCGLIAALEARALPACVDALARLGDPSAIPVLADRLHADVTRERCMTALRGFDPSLVRPHLLRALSGARLYEGAERAAWSAARAGAATLLGEIGGADGALIAALDDGHPDVRESAALALAAHGNTSPPVLHVLVDALGNESWMRADAAMEALQCSGPAALDQVVRVLTSGESARAHRCRLRAIDLLGRSGDLRATAWLWPLSNADDARTRLEVVAAFGHLGPNALQLVARMLEDPAPSVRRAAAERLLAAGDASISALAQIERRRGRVAHVRAQWIAWRLARMLRRRARVRSER